MNDSDPTILIRVHQNYKSNNQLIGAKGAFSLRERDVQYIGFPPQENRSYLY